MRPPRSNFSGNYRVLIAVALLPLCLAGCGSLQVALGLKTRLDKLPVTAVSAVLSPDAALVPGTTAKLVITTTTADGKTLVSEGAGQGKVLFDSFALTGQVVTVKSNGKVSLPEDPRQSDGVTPEVDVTVKGHPDVTTQLKIGVRYDAAFSADFSGAPGAAGFDGLAGMDGSTGSPGSNDPNSPSAGGQGGAGSNGSDGDNGHPGSPGQAVQAWVTFLPTRGLLQVKLAGSSSQRYFLIDPKGGSLTVTANGGAGGRGGSGGRGGNGGAGGSGSPDGMSGPSGSNGMDGRPGPDGAPGSFVVHLDPAARPYLALVNFSNSRGTGRGAPADIRVEPVAALW